ncbi:DUF1990 family protein [Vallicoccus soli]|uniref:DUF1990 domain-containing protein n=1 Tax=Vallicoccus soli TaxID=2339232 RepID=A0A3A3Z1D6_9ACTN|nr:DUF1990 domain-containing protein [Vallicoccus soli]RJK97065.1 DUF1990 domain-containing protein [Vallicoccus soli]
MEDLLRRAVALEPTHRDVGASLRPAPEGWDALDVRAYVGHGPADHAAAAEAVLGWRMHEGAGLAVAASDPVARGGTTVALGLGAGPLRVRFACRVVVVVDEPGARGFAYATLPGHPETGEESFVVRTLPSGLVVLDVRAVSRPAWGLVRLAGPLGRLAQRAAVHAYARAVRRAVVAAR